MGTFSLGMDNRSLGTAWVLTPLLHHGNDFSAIPNSTEAVPKPKRDLKNMPGVLSAGKERGPSPSFFPPHPPSLGLFSAPYAMEVPQKKEKIKVKKWSNAYREGGTGVNRI
jgi:hypothetical protein